jgi:hypothetical protein
MLIAELSPEVYATWAGIVVTICGATGGSFLASRIVLATLCAKVEALAGEVSKIASGDTGIMGVLRTKVDQHGNEIQEIFGRLRKVEDDHARNHLPREKLGS